MKYRRYGNGVETVYAYSDIVRSVYTGSGYDPATDRSRAGDFTFLFRDGHNVTHPGLLDWSYGTFHGLTISMDGTKFFLQGWENGIRCYDLINGRPIWKNRIRRTRNLLVSEHSLVAVTGDRKLIAISVDTGLVTAERTGFRQVIDVTEKLCMAVDREKQCFLVDKDTLETRLTFPGKLHECTIDILPAGKKLYALTEMLSDTVPREPVYRLHGLPLPEDADPALWESRYTVRRMDILREAYGLSVDNITEKARDDLFRVEYAIAAPEKQFAEADGGEVYGLFRIRAGKREYGLWYHEENGGVPYDACLLYWMDSLTEALLAVRLGATAYVRDIGTPCAWLRFRSELRDGTNTVYMNAVRAVEEIQDIGVLRSLPVPEEALWETDAVIPWQFFEAEVTTVSERLRKEIRIWQNSASGEKTITG